jgi:cAMP-dependent protein kinase regulator
MLQSPLDRALSLSLSGEHEAALAIAGRFLLGALANPAALFLVGRTLSDLQELDLANSAFELAIKQSLRSGNLPLAIAACRELERVGVDASASLDTITRTFAKGSDSLVEEHRAPPEITLALPTTAPFEETGSELLTRVARVLSDAEALLTETDDQPLQVHVRVPFSSLEPEALAALISAFQEVTVDTGYVLIEEGTPGSEAYLLARGELEVRRRNRDPDAEPMTLARLGSGALFGEMALLSRSPRAASVVACRPSVVLCASKDALDAVAKAQPSVAATLAQFTRRRMIDNLVRTSSILSAVHVSKRAALLERFMTRTFEAGDKLITQGEESTGLYLVASGSLSVIHRSDELPSDDDLAISKLGPGDVVGEVALVLRRPSNADVVAEHPTVTLHLPRDEFLDLVKAHPEVLAELYELAVKRDEETRSLVAQEATDVDEFILL